jgi:release factor glutamine methyltransferase
MFAESDLQSIYKELTSNLENIHSKNESKSIVRLLFEHLGYSNLELITNKSQIIPQEQIKFLDAALHRLHAYEPIQYILGKVDFYGLQFEINPSALIPRQETEELVDMVLKETEGNNPKILDIGTGSGCIALSLKSNMPKAKVDALDNSELALAIAVENSRNLELNVHFHHIDILHEAILPGDYDIIVSNPPYVTETDKSVMGENVIEYEPHNALFVPNEAPLIFYDCIVELAALHLHQNGKLYFEINESLGSQVKTLLSESGFQNVRIIKDLNGKDRFAIGTWFAKT